jgi:hypothetical protein
MRILTGTWRRLTPRTKLRLLHAYATRRARTAL